jgi:hypothetical protein
LSSSSRRKLAADALDNAYANRRSDPAQARPARIHQRPMRALNPCAPFPAQGAFGEWRAHMAIKARISIAGLFPVLGCSRFF